MKTTIKASGYVEVDLPIRIYPEANLREHAITRWKRSKKHDEAVFYTLVGSRELLKLLKAQGPLLVTLTAIGPKALDDDNLVGGFKHVRDSVARFLGIDDGNKARIRFHYAEQEIAKKHGARVRIERRPE